MRNRLLHFILAGVICFWAPDSLASRLRFQSEKSANLFWILDQISRWDKRYTSPAYFEYWNDKLKFTEEDLAVLDRYARQRRRLARLDDSEVKKKTSPWAALFGSPNLLPHQRFSLAFLETRKVPEALALLKLSREEEQILMNTLRHFAARLKDHFKGEIAHEGEFIQKAEVLLSLANVEGFIDQVQRFYGTRGPVPQEIPVDVLWAPPGRVRPVHMSYHIILPVSIEHARNDEAVLQHLSLAMQEVGQFLLERTSVETLGSASRRVLEECGLVNDEQPDVMRKALQAALGEGLFLRERFPDLPFKELMVPWDKSVEYPYLGDELARSFVNVLKESFQQPGSFLSFVEKAIKIQKLLVPVRPRFFASTAIVLADPGSAELFNSMFKNIDRVEVGIDKPDDFADALAREPGRSAFIVVTPQYEGALWKAIRNVEGSKKLARDFRNLTMVSFIYPLKREQTGMIFVVRGLGLSGVRKALVKLHSLDRIPLGLLKVE